MHKVRQAFGEGTGVVQLHVPCCASAGLTARDKVDTARLWGQEALLALSCTEGIRDLHMIEALPQGQQRHQRVAVILAHHLSTALSHLTREKTVGLLYLRCEPS